MTSTMDKPAIGKRTDPIPGIDLARPDLHHVMDLQAVFADLRREHPVFWHGEKSHAGFWAVTRHSEAVRVYRDIETFTATHGMTLDSLRSDRDPAVGLMVEVTDPPDHRRLRRGIGGFFSAGAVSAMTAEIDALVVRLLKEIRARDEPVDFVAAVANRVPTFAAGLLLGLPAEDLDWIASRTSRVFLSGQEASDGQPVNLREQAERANADLLGYFAKLVRSGRHRSGTRGLVQQLAEGSANRDGLTTGEVVLNALNMAIAGNETTRCSLGNMVLALIQFPDSFQALRRDRALVATAVEEVARWANPVRHLTRVATRDVGLGGQHVTAGDPVVVWPQSANRDETVFDLPHVFDVHRYPNPHIGFATGTHSCPGSGLARAQMRTVLSHMVELFETVELAGVPKPVRSNFMQGYESLPVRFTAAPGLCDNHGAQDGT